MRPVELKMEYFGPHKDTLIDFDKFNNELFLISGDTGSGKTTIFDAMTFALYGDTSGSRSAEKMRSDFATLNDVTRIDFIFEHLGSYYKVERRWTPIKKKKALSGQEKFNELYKENVEFSRIDMADRHPLGQTMSKKTEIAKFIEELLQLSADQFRQIILLPQNNFQKFLAADSNGKHEILAKIFASQIYADITASLKEQEKSLATDRQDAEKEMDRLFASILERFEDEISTEEIQDPNKRLEHIEELSEVVKTSKAEAEKNLIQKSAVLEDINNQISKAENLLKQRSDLASKKENLFSLEEQEANFDQIEKKIAALSWSQDIKELFDSYLRSQKEVENISQKIATDESSIKSLEEQEKELVKEEERLAEEEPKYKKAQVDLDRLKNKELPQALRLESLTKNLETTSTSLEACLKEVKQLEADLDANKLKSEEKQIEKESFRGLNEEQGKLSNLNLRARDLAYNNEKLLTNQENLAGQQSSLAEISGQIESLNSELSEVQKDLQLKKSQRQSIMITMLQEELVDGDECMVCGSTDHPKISHETTSSSEDLKLALTAIDEVQSNYDRLASRLESLSSQKSNLQEDIDTLENLVQRESIDFYDEYESFKNDWNQAFVSFALTDSYDRAELSSQYEKIKSQIEDKLEKDMQLSEELSVLSNEREKLSSHFNQLQLDNKGYQTQYDSLNLEIKNIKQEYPSLADRKNIEKEINSLDSYSLDFERKTKNLVTKRTNLNNEKFSLESLYKEHNENLMSMKKDFDILSKNFQDEISASEFVNNEEELASLLDDLRELQDLTARLENYRVKISSLKEEIVGLEEDLVTNSFEFDMNKLLEDKNEYRQDYEKYSQELGSLQERYVSLLADIDKYKKELALIAANFEEYRNLQLLADTFYGKNSYKLSLEKFVTQQYLKRILEEANESYMLRLTNNRYFFEIDDSIGRGGGQNTTGLEINIYDQEIGKSRSVRTLSGGESFIASLSIALATSDVIQNQAGGIKIDSLFIDEGFGSLDQDTLAKAMEALETLGHDGRMIGVISHVDAMKQRIGQQLIINKAGNGMSKVVERVL